MTAVSAVDSRLDAHFMAVALMLGRRGLGNTWPNPAVGAVLVKWSGDAAHVVGRGWTQPGGRPHAEPEALNRAAGAASGGTLYVTLEPCSHHGKTPPCVDAIIAAGVFRVVSAMEDPNPKVAGQGHARLVDSGVCVTTGVAEEVARRTHAGHIRRVRDGRPHVTLKLAVSADGKAGLAGRRPAVITGPSARARAHLMRAMSDAILVGIGTVWTDDPALTCRLPGMAKRSPLRIVLDQQLRLPHESRLVQTARDVPVWVITSARAPLEAEARLQDRGVAVVRLETDRSGRIDLDVMLRELARRGITRLMVEGGPTVAASFIAADLVDEAVLMRSDRSLGPDGIDAIEGMSLGVVTRSAQFVRTAAQRIGCDQLETFERA